MKDIMKLECVLISTNVSSTLLAKPNATIIYKKKNVVNSKNDSKI